MEAEERWRDYPLDAWLDDCWSCVISDPSPQELSRDGRTYYLAHSNANRAVYSAGPPPVEQTASC